jgi:hypothetical protein
MNKPNFTKEEKQMLVIIDKAYEQWRKGHAYADNKTAFRAGYLRGVSGGLTEAMTIIGK